MVVLSSICPFYELERELFGLPALHSKREAYLSVTIRRAPFPHYVIYGPLIIANKTKLKYFNH